jgi:hypothetical protein
LEVDVQYLTHPHFHPVDFGGAYNRPSPLFRARVAHPGTT